MVAVTMRQGTTTIPAEIPAREAVSGNVVYRPDGEWVVVKAPPEWWMEGQRA